MAKRKKSATSKKSAPKNVIDNVEDIDSEAEEFIHDEVDLFHLRREKNEEQTLEGDSDELEDDQEEVLGIEDESEEEIGREGEDLSSDEDGEEELEEGWGKRKSTFFGAESLEGLQGHDRDAVMDAEEEEATRIQQRLLQEVDEEQFDIFAKIPKLVEMSEGTSLVTQQKEEVETDITQLSEDTRWKMIEQDSPELPQLIEDFKTKSEELQTRLYPLLKLVDHGFIKGGGALYVKTKLNATLMYLINISFYMNLKMQKISVENHPVISRLVQYRTVLNKMKKVDKKLNSEIEEVLKMDIDESYFDSEEKDISVNENTKSKLLELPPLPNPVDYFTALQERLKKQKVEKPKQEEEIPEAEENGDDIDERRAINYKMSKNKGMTSKRRKMDRNPRVKHREKFRKAKIRRRGEVREYKPELKKYSGEMSGIRAGIIRGVRLK